MLKVSLPAMGSKPGRRIYRDVDFEMQLLPLNIFMLPGFLLLRQVVSQEHELDKA
jgi:hypothetical protein